jgi:transposase
MPPAYVKRGKTDANDAEAICEAVTPDDAVRSNELSQRLSTIPGIGLISATVLAASVTDPERFRSGRQFAASLGLTPLQNSSGGKERMGRIPRLSDRYLRRLLVLGMTSLRWAASCCSRP